MQALSTGCSQLDALIEALWPGDNVVFVGGAASEYAALSQPALAFAQKEHLQRVRLVPDETTIELEEGTLLLRPSDIWDAETGSFDPRVLDTLTPHAYVVADELSALLADEQQAVAFFTTVCPYLYHRASVAYWHLAPGRFSAHAVAAIRDCTQVLFRLEGANGETILTPLKVLGRYADDMFRPHRLVLDSTVSICPLHMDTVAQDEYAQMLEEKNRELAAIRDELNRANARLEEQNRLYDSLSANLDQLVDLLEAGRSIGASLRLEQVQQTVVKTAMALFQGERCCLTIQGLGKTRVIEAGQVDEGSKQELRSYQIAVPMREPRAGRLQVWTRSRTLDDGQTMRLLGYLASEAGIALENAELYGETETQRQQLRAFVNGVIADEERHSRQLALDLHDGLVQQIVAAYQHLQTAEAWRERDPDTQEQEIEQGIRILRQSIIDARRLIGQLRPAGLDDFGLARAVRLFVSQQAASNEWSIDLEIDPSWPTLSATTEAALYRIIQEATNNARKYAESDRLSIALKVQEQGLAVEVRDWGQGFSPDAVLSRPAEGLHMGLVGIRERVNLLGGTCEIKSAPGQGASVCVDLPSTLITEEHS